MKRLITLLISFLFLALSISAEVTYSSELEAKAKSGDAGAQCDLGVCYETGNGVAQNWTKAAEWYAKSAEQGNAPAQSNLGWCYEKGKGVAQSWSKAAEWYTKAAEQGNARAQNNLGWCYENGTGVAQNWSKAVEWYTKSAEQGNAPAQCNLGSCYANGNGVAQSWSKAVEWYTKSAEQGNAPAQFNLGWCYEKGKGVAQSWSKAAEWYSKAAEQGYARAQNSLGVRYHLGEGVTKDYKKAKELYEKAIAGGNELAKDNLAILEAIPKSDPAWNVTTKTDPKALPILNIESVEFADNGDNTIEAGESYSISVKVSNTGKGTARGCALRIKAPSAPGITAKEVKLPDIAPGKSHIEKVQLTAGTNTVNGRAEFSVEIDEPNGMGPDPTLLAVATKAFEAPRVLVSDYSVTSTQGTQIEKRKPFDLQLLVQNMAHGRAEDVDVTITVPQNVFIVEGDESKRLGTLDAGDTREMNYSLLVNNNYSATTIPVKVSLREKHGKYAESKTIELRLNQSLAQNRIDVKAAENQSHKEIAQAQIAGKTRQAEVDYDIPAGKECRDKTFAVVIGNENYRNEIAVPFAANDAMVFGQYLTTTFGVPDKNVHVVTDATRNDIIAQLDWLAKVSKAYNGECNLIVYYSGHGMPDESSKSSLLIPVDGYSSNTETCFGMDKFYKKLADMGASHATVILDACFSGAQRGDGMLMAARGVAIKPHTAEPTGNIVVLSASQGDETAYPYTEKGHGMFTYYLLKKMQDTAGKVTIGELYDYATQEVGRRSVVENLKSQTPSVSVSPALSGKWRNLRW